MGALSSVRGASGALRTVALAAAGVLALGVPVASAETRSAAHDPALALVGVWGAKRSFGPEARGTLTFHRDEAGWAAEIGGYRVAAGADPPQ